MALVTANGIAVADLKLELPATGAWTAEAVVVDASAISGAVELAIDGSELSFKGTAVPSRTGAFLDSAVLRIVGGAGGLPKMVRPRAFANAKLRDVLSKVLEDAGEVLSASSDAGVLDLSLTRWIAIRQEVGLAIASLLAAAPAGTNWRVLPDGSVWVGPETWPDADIGEYQLIQDFPAEGRRIIGGEAPLLLPGTTLDGARASYVEHRVRSSSVRSTFWLDP